MTDRITTSDLKKMLVEAALCLREHRDQLSRLDSIAGDGDHGTTMLRVAEQMETAAEDESLQSPAALLKDCGWKILNVDGGASSALLGTFFRGMADRAGEDDPDCRTMAGILESGIGALLKQSRAKPGDKTMVDALTPAIIAFRSAAEAGKPISSALEDAAAAARDGAESTKALVARCGRSRFLGEKTLGHVDAGATSISLLFHGFMQAFSERRDDQYA